MKKAMQTVRTLRVVELVNERGDDVGILQLKSRRDEPTPARRNRRKSRRGRQATANETHFEVVVVVRSVDVRRDHRRELAAVLLGVRAANESTQ
jgi:hypothetical protein